MSFPLNRNPISPRWLLFGRGFDKVPPFPADNQIIRFNATTNKWELSTGGVLSAVQSSSNVGSGAGLALARVGDDLPFKSITFTVGNILITTTATEINIDVGANVVRVDKTNLWQSFDQTFQGDFFYLEHSANGNRYRSMTSAITADRNVTYPLLLANDTYVFQNHIQALIGKTLVLASNTITDTGALLGDLAKHNGTKYVRFPKGTSLQQIRVNAGGTDLEYFTPAPATVSSIIANCYATEAPANNEFLSVVGIAVKDSTESERHTVMPKAVTMQNLTVEVSINPSATVTNFTHRVNGADGNLTIAIGAGLTGTFTDAVNSDALVMGDLIDYQITFTGSAITFDSASMEVLA